MRYRLFGRTGLRVSEARFPTALSVALVIVAVVPSRRAAAPAADTRRAAAPVAGA